MDFRPLAGAEVPPSAAACMLPSLPVNTRDAAVTAAALLARELRAPGDRGPSVWRLLMLPVLAAAAVWKPKARLGTLLLNVEARTKLRCSACLQSLHADVRAQCTRMQAGCSDGMQVWSARPGTCRAKVKRSDCVGVAMKIAASHRQSENTCNQQRKTRQALFSKGMNEGRLNECMVDNQ